MNRTPAIVAKTINQNKDNKILRRRGEMNALREKLFLLGIFVCVSGVVVDCILTKTAVTPETKVVEKPDNAVEQSIKRDYIAGYDESGYNHESYGLSAHSGYNFPEGGYEGYGTSEGGKHYIHYPKDHHYYHHHEDHHKQYDLGYHKALAIKSLLVPLAGVALLGAAAAFVSNPILLQLGVISGSSVGRRKREVEHNYLQPQGTVSREDRIRLNEIKFLERFMAQLPDQSIRDQEKRMVANYLSCSSALRKNLCLERLTCELHSVEGAWMAMEANVLTIALKEILDNEFVADDVKSRLEKATERGRKNFGCEIYECKELEKRGATL